MDKIISVIKSALENKPSKTSVETRRAVLKCYPTDNNDINSIVSTINKIRKDNKLPLLNQDKRLNLSATRKADDMVKKNYWSHQDPDGKYSWDIIKNSGYKYKTAGENLARNFDNIKTVEAWLQSPTHLEIILNPNYKDIGVGKVGKISVIHLGSE